MILKKAVLISLILGGLATILLLAIGFGPGNKSASVETGALPAGAVTNADGSVTLPDGQVVQPGQVVTDSNGQQIVVGGNTSTSSGSTTSGGNTGSTTSSSGSTSTTTGGGTTGGTTGGSTGGTGGGTTPSAAINSFSASPSSVSYNSASTLSWSASNVSSCTISPSLGSVGASGTKSTGNLTASTTYTLTCGGVTKQASVSVGAAPATCGQAGGSCTAAQVATHNTQSNCWVRYNGYYYIVTNYISSHPGGRSVFNSSTCGQDITAYMTGASSTAGTRHTHSSGAYTTLNNYRIGPVQG